ncbi:hypothetical protein MG296_07395 [Flavobacteriaceae bacterium TK19130]|nr:hypothetical protein [Thermobacterium salinum]
MSTRLSKITPQYSQFVDDQVLTSAKLNEFIEYFDEQDRLSRVCLTGVGIACGFEVRYDASENTITISQGCGVTTDGDLLKLQNDVPAAEIDDSSFRDIKLITVPNITYTHFRDFEDERAKYKPFRAGNSTIDLWELLPEEAVNTEEGHAPLSQFQDLGDKVVLLYLECYPKDPDICTGTNCDNQGQPIIQNVRVLLAGKENTYEIINGGDTLFEKHDVLAEVAAMDRLVMPKVVLNADLGAENNVGSYAALHDAYEEVLGEVKPQMAEAFNSLFASFSETLMISEASRAVIENAVKNIDTIQTGENFQYRYDWARDMVDTYNELFELLLKLKSECCPDIEAFPKHLLLGSLQPQDEYPELRHDFYHATINNEFSSLLKHAKSLVSRLEGIATSYDAEFEGRPLITPSKDCSPLGEKAIPAYYTISENLLKRWDFVKTERFHHIKNLSYHREALAEGSWVRNPLNVELECHDFYRIEGLYGRSGLEVKDYLNSLRKEFALDFECRLYDVETQREEITALLRNYPGITHRAGVPKGGTFFLFTENDEVIADFCLPHAIETRAQNASCCYLRECTYPWISSLKFLNNLSRSLKGTQSNNRPMPQEYRLQVIEYKINGQSLINRTTTLDIPLEAIFLRRMHAITDALNTRFDKGLVFDFNESQKRFVITYSKEDKFVLRVRDVTMARNNAIYTYSNSGMFRNNRVFRPDAMRCRDLKNYNPAFYEALQASLAPVNKDDDYGTYDDKWAKWTRLRDRLQRHPLFMETQQQRFITSVSELPSAMRTKLSNIADAIGRINPQLSLQLDGDWVNGIWIDDLMLTHARRNKKNTHDDVVLFVNLRKFLHKKTGVTKLSLYIQGAPYSSDFDELLATHGADADFYFGSPRGENAISVPLQ